MVCCGAGTTFSGSDFCSALFLVLSSLPLALIVLYLLPVFALWLRVWLWELMVSPLPVRSMWPMRLPVVWEVSCCSVFVWFVVTLVRSLLYLPIPFSLGSGDL